MSIDAAAEALATDTALPEQVAPIDTPQDEDAELSAIFQKGQTEAPEEAPQEAQPESEQPEAQEAPQVEAPSELPKSVRDHWSKIPEDVRPAILESQRELSRKLGEQGRMVQGIAPIRDVLVQAAKDIPALANMRPDDVAKEVFQLAKISGDFQTRPVETMMGLIKQHGLEQQMQQALAGQQVTGGNEHALKQQIAQLERQLKQVADPEYLRNEVTKITSETQTAAEVTKFAQSAQHWDAVEQHIPSLIPVARAKLTKLGESTTPQAVLSQAYEMAVGYFVPEDKRATPPAAEQAAATVNPRQAEAAIKAKSVNVKSGATGRAREPSEDELLGNVYDRHKA